jgi:hypothetical protein
MPCGGFSGRLRQPQDHSNSPESESTVIRHSIESGKFRDRRNIKRRGFPARVDTTPEPWQKVTIKGG